MTCPSFGARHAPQTRGQMALVDAGRDDPGSPINPYGRSKRDDRLRKVTPQSERGPMLRHRRDGTPAPMRCATWSRYAATLKLQINPAFVRYRTVALQKSGHVQHRFHARGARCANEGVGGYRPRLGHHVRPKLGAHLRGAFPSRSLGLAMSHTTPRSILPFLIPTCSGSREWPSTVRGLSTMPISRQTRPHAKPLGMRWALRSSMRSRTGSVISLG